jgi:hypothetical protein
VWVWSSFGLLLVLLGARAWVVETGQTRLRLGRTPVRVRFLTGACALAAALVVTTVTANGGARLAYLLLHPQEAVAEQEARKDAEDAAGRAAEDAAERAARPPPAPAVPGVASPAVPGVASPAVPGAAPPAVPAP